MREARAGDLVFQCKLPTGHSACGYPSEGMVRDAKQISKPAKIPMIIGKCQSLVEIATIGTRPTKINAKAVMA
jgi:hypothetical protein